MEVSGTGRPNMRCLGYLMFAAGLVALAAGPAAAQDAGMKKWTKGKGWGWVWGPEDEVGNLNELTPRPALPP